MKVFISILLLVAAFISTIVSQRCFDPRPLPLTYEYEWFSIDGIDYTYTIRNNRWTDAERRCRIIVPGRSRVATIESRWEWDELRKVVKPGWYWMDNTKLPSLTSPRYFHFDKTGRVLDPRQLDTTKRCLVHSHRPLSEWERGSSRPEKTDFYCQDYRERDLWAKVLCEVRC